jgi:hypothetical protein
MHHQDQSVTIEEAAGEHMHMGRRLAGDGTMQADCPMTSRQGREASQVSQTTAPRASAKTERTEIAL